MLEILLKEWIEQIKYYIHLIADYSIKKSQVGAVLDDVLNLSGKMFRSKLLLLCAFLGSNWKNNKENYSTEYTTFVSTSNKLVEQLVAALKSGDESLVLNTINKLRENLHYLESFSNIPMETAAMKNYIASYPAGKQSGSGSGDIVLGFNRSNDNFQLQLNLEQL